MSLDSPKPRGNPNWVKRPATTEEGVPVVHEAPISAKITMPSSENEDARRAMYREVTRRILAGERFAIKDSNIFNIELHSADLDTVYIFKENRGNGDKRNCKAVPIWEFCAEMGIEVTLGVSKPVVVQPLVSGEVNVSS